MRLLDIDLCIHRGGLVDYPSVFHGCDGEKLPVLNLEDGTGALDIDDFGL